MVRLFLLLILFCSGNALAAPMYQVVDEKGNVTFTDKPPADGAQSNSKELEQKPMNVLEAPKGQDFQKSFERHQAQAQEARKSAWQTYDEALVDAEQKLDAAKAAQKEGEIVKEGDMIATQGRKRGAFMRPTEEYLERQEALKRAVDDAAAHLAAVRKQKPALRRN